MKKQSIRKRIFDFLVITERVIKFKYLVCLAIFIILLGALRQATLSKRLIGDITYSKTRAKLSRNFVNATSKTLPVPYDFKFEKLVDKPIHVLLWTSMYGDPSWNLGFDFVDQNKPFLHQCPAQNCHVWRDRRLLANASAVLVHFRDDFDYNDVPREGRTPNQFWTFVLSESPLHTYSWNPTTSSTSRHYLSERFRGFFNWTMTYRLDSDIPLHYGWFERQKAPIKQLKPVVAASKPKFAVTMASNCWASSGRVELIRELQRYIDIEVIGFCSDSPQTAEFNHHCKPTPDDRGTSPECLQYLSSTFKFYLAFENSLCLDYVTEKFFRAATLDLIPVVLNGANMSKFAPPNSYIDVNDFDSPGDLARYLVQVSSNQTLYASYFEWRTVFEKPKYHWDSQLFLKSFCHLCVKLNEAVAEPEKHRKVYDDLDNWWMAGGQCRKGILPPNQTFRNLTERMLLVFLVPFLVASVYKVLFKFFI